MLRKNNYKQAGVKSAAEATERRRLQTAGVTKQRREALLRAKRLRREPGCHDSDVAAEPSPEQLASQVTEAVIELATITQFGTRAHVDALRKLRRLLSSGEELPCQAALQAGGLRLLVKALQPVSTSAEALQAVLEAAWTVSNLAAAEHAVVAAVLPAAPILIAHLGGGCGTLVAEQCAWALGNIAGDCAEFRQTLAANGAVRPLAQLMAAARTAASGSSGAAVAAAGRTAAWALSNLIKGAGPEVGELLAVPGLPEAVVQLLGQARDSELVTETAWVLAYVTASAQAHLNRMVALGVLPPLLHHLQERSQQVEQDADAGRALLTPILRSVGNVAAGGGASAVSKLLTDPAGAVASLLRCAQSSQRGLQKESVWVLANMAGAPGSAGVQALLHAGSLPVLTGLLKNAAFDLKKEAAFAVANICSGGGDGRGDAATLSSLIGSDPGVLQAFLSLLKAPDPEANQLGLQVIEMVLQVMPDGQQAVEAADGIDALEELQYRGHPELQGLAAQLVDKYFGEDYGL